MAEGNFLPAILAAPDDDGPRLVYADWLEEHGNPERAEFIRLQVQLERLDPCDPRRRPLRRREKELLDAHAERWCGLDRLRGLHYPEFRRGFVEHAVFESCGDFLTLAPRTLERTPLGSVEVRDYLPYDEFLDSPLLERLRRLTFLQRDGAARWRLARSFGAYGGGPNPLGRLLRSPRLGGLRGLNVRGGRSEGPFLGAFRDADALAGLEVLTLFDPGFGAEELANVTDTPHLANLRRLRVTGGDSMSGTGDALVRLLRDSPYLKRLEALDLAMQPLSRRGYEVLAAWPGLAGLRRLGLAWATDYGDHFALGVRALAHSPYWRDLRELDVTGAVADPPEAEALLSSPRLASLRRLAIDPRVNDYESPDEVGLMLARCPYLEDLIELDLGSYDPGPEAERLLRERFGDRLVWPVVERRLPP